MWVGLRSHELGRWQLAERTGGRAGIGSPPTRSVHAHSSCRRPTPCAPLEQHGARAVGGKLAPRAASNFVVHLYREGGLRAWIANPAEPSSQTNPHSSSAAASSTQLQQHAAAAPAAPGRLEQRGLQACLPGCSSASSSVSSICRFWSSYPARMPQSTASRLSCTNTYQGDLKEGCGSACAASVFHSDACVVFADRAQVGGAAAWHAVHCPKTAKPLSGAERARPPARPPAPPASPASSQPPPAAAACALPRSPLRWAPPHPPSCHPVLQAAAAAAAATVTGGGQGQPAAPSPLLPPTSRRPCPRHLVPLAAHHGSDALAGSTSRGQRGGYGRTNKAFDAAALPRAV